MLPDKGKYGQSPEGFLAYVKEQIGALRKCEAKGVYTHKECALYFETLGNEEEELFFHADQVRMAYSARCGGRIFPIRDRKLISLLIKWNFVCASFDILSPSFFEVCERDVRSLPRGLAAALPKNEPSHH